MSWLKMRVFEHCSQQYVNRNAGLDSSPLIGFNTPVNLEIDFFLGGIMNGADSNIFSF